MRVVLVTTEHLTPSRFDGGLANYLHRLSIALVADGHEAIVIAPSDRTETTVEGGVRTDTVRWSCGPLLRTLDLITLRRVHTLLTLLSLSWRLNARVRQVHREAPVDVVQYTHLSGVALFRSRQLPSLIRLSSYSPIVRRTGGYPRESRLAMRHKELLERWALRRADAVFGPGLVEAAAVQAELGIGVEIIESPFFLETTTLDDGLYRQLLACRPYLLFVGYLNEIKGVPTIAAILHELLDRHPELHFAFAGREDPGLCERPLSEHLLASAGEHRERVVLLGMQPHSRLYPVIAQARAVVLPSLTDNFPNTCLEAMAHRRVVVGSRRTSMEQLLEDGDSGLLCEPGDPQSLLEAIERALAMSPEECLAMGERAAARLEPLKPERALAPLLDLYQRVRTAHRRRRSRAGA